MLEDRRRLERELADARKALAMAGVNEPRASRPERWVAGPFSWSGCRRLDPKDLRSTIDTLKQRVGSGIAALIAVNEAGQAFVGVTDDLTGQVSAVDLLKAAVAALGGQGGGGRPDMAQGGGPDGSKAKEALDAVKDASEKVAA